MAAQSFKKVRQRRVRQYTPPVNPKKNLQGLLIACAVTDTTPGRAGPSNPGREKKLLQRVALHGATPLLLPPEMIEVFARDPNALGMPGEIAIVLCVEVKETIVDDQSKGWTNEFAAWLVREYPKARLNEKFSSHTIRAKDLMRAYEVTLDTVYQKYRLASSGMGPYPTFRRTSGTVRFLTNCSAQIASFTYSNAMFSPGQFWDWVIECTLDAVRVRRSNGSSHVRCGRSKWVAIPHTGAPSESDAPIKRLEKRTTLFSRFTRIISRSSSS